MASCAIPTCSHPSLAKGLCNAHYLRLSKGSTNTGPIEFRVKGKVCKEPNCNLFTVPKGGRGWCRRHYKFYRGRERTRELIKLHGDCCAKCKQQFPDVAYDFHHRNPAEKSFTIGNQITNHSMADLIVEANKCDLLCAICHRIHHFGDKIGVF